MSHFLIFIEIFSNHKLHNKSSCPSAQNFTEKNQILFEYQLFKKVKVYPQNCHILGVKLDHILLYPKTIDISLTIKIKFFGKKNCNLQTVTIFKKEQKNGCISSKKSHFESENLPKPFSIAPTCAPEFFFGCDKKCPRYHNFKKKRHF